MFCSQLDDVLARSMAASTESSADTAAGGGALGESLLGSGMVFLAGLVLFAAVAVRVLLGAGAQTGKRRKKGTSSPLPHVPHWVSAWLVTSSIIVVWDASFVLRRPQSFDEPLYLPYRDYVKVDRLYGDLSDAFVWGQAVVNLLEVALNLVALYFVSQSNTESIRDEDPRGSPMAKTYLVMKWFSKKAENNYAEHLKSVGWMDLNP